MNPWVLARGAVSQPWRLWTCHALHFGWKHALFNLIALLVPFALLRPRAWPGLAAALLVLAPLLSLALLPGLGEAQYRGASGLACAAWALAGIQLARDRTSRLEGALLLGGLGLKVLLETFGGTSVLPSEPGWLSLPAAHQWGMALGLAFSPILAWLPGRTKDLPRG